MAGQSVTKTVQQQQPPPTDTLTHQTMRYGASAGVAGLIFGTTTGIIGGRPPLIRGFAMGIVWLTSTSVFWATRQLVLSAHGQVSQATSLQKVAASAIAGASGGATYGVFNGPRSMNSKFGVGCFVGGGAQLLLSIWEARRASAPEVDEKNRWSWKKILPLKELTDHEYEKTLEDKILQIEANIAIVDENIAALETQRTTTSRPTNAVSTTTKP